MIYKSIITTNEEAEWLRINHLEKYLSVDIISERDYINKMTGPSQSLKTINDVLNTQGPNKLTR